MRYFTGGLLHQNKFPVKFIGPNLSFPWLLVFYYLTHAFVLVLFISSTSHSHPLCRTSRLQMLFKIGVPKNFANFTGKYRCSPVKFAKFAKQTPPLAVSIYFSFHERFSFYFSVVTLPLLPYSIVTFFVWRNSFVFISLLLHHYYHNNRMIHQDCWNCYDLLHCHFHDSYTC